MPQTSGASLQLGETPERVSFPRGLRYTSLAQRFLPDCRVMPAEKSAGSTL